MCNLFCQEPFQDGQALSGCFCQRTFPLAVYKVDAETGLPLSGAVFSLSCCGSVIACAVTGQNGAACFWALRPGCYTLTEVTPPAGYQPASESFQVQLDCCGRIWVDGCPVRCLCVSNTRVTGTLTGIKYDVATGRRLSGAVFELRQDGAAVASGTSDADGLLTFGNLSPGTYSLVETVAPAGYAAMTASHTVVVAGDGSITVDGFPGSTVSLANTPIERDVTFAKTSSSTGAPLAGAVFQLRQGASVIGTATSDATGAVRFSKVPVGTYTMVETAVPAGYQLSSAVRTVVVSASGDVTVDGEPLAGLVITNAPLGRFTITKTSTSGAPLSGGVFTLTEDGAPLPAAIATSNAAGNALFKDIVPGAYRLAEITAPAGHRPNPRIFPVVIRPNGEVYIDGEPQNTFTVQNSRLDVRL